MIHPYHLYCVQVHFSVRLKKCTTELEKAQKKMTKVIKGMKQGCEGRKAA